MSATAFLVVLAAFVLLFCVALWLGPPEIIHKGGYQATGKMFEKMTPPKGGTALRRLSGPVMEGRVSKGGQNSAYKIERRPPAPHVKGGLSGPNPLRESGSTPDFRPLRHGPGIQPEGEAAAPPQRQPSQPSIARDIESHPDDVPIDCGTCGMTMGRPTFSAAIAVCRGCGVVGPVVGYE